MLYTWYSEIITCLIICVGNPRGRSIWLHIRQKIVTHTLIRNRTFVTSVLEASSFCPCSMLFNVKGLWHSFWKLKRCLCYWNIMFACVVSPPAYCSVFGCVFVNFVNLYHLVWWFWVITRWQNMSHINQRIVFVYSFFSTLRTNYLQTAFTLGRSTNVIVTISNFMGWSFSNLFVSLHTHTNV